MRNNVFINGDIAEIQLLHGLVTLIDKSDYDWLKDLDVIWHASYDKNGNWYVKSVRMENGKKKRIILARIIMGEPDGLVIDHINHNTLDNRKLNLRACTYEENNRNRKKWERRPLFKYDGVHKIKADKKHWMVTILVGNYETKEEAISAYDDAASLLFG